MLFNSWNFIFIFLPITFGLYFLANRMKLARLGKAWLTLASLIFYGHWNPRYIPLILLLILFNFGIGTRLAKSASAADTTADNASGGAARSGIRSRKTLLVCGITVNLAVLAYFKYANFFVENFNALSGWTLALPNVVLPLAISFFTFQKIAYLVDCHSGRVKDKDLLNYSLFVLFFPQLISGPIVHYREMMPQFRSLRNLAIRHQNIFNGLYIFGLGLFKKVILADSFALWANAGFNSQQPLDFLFAWATSLSYTFQLYFDFSGYCDMAIGAALLFNIRLPINFNSPYQALSIQDFWRRWHITLSNFLRDYLYIPLGGNRHGAPRTGLNLSITFLLGGLWHGASWMFVIWGGLHGLALIVHRLWSARGLRLPKPLAWAATFFFVNFAWIFFRAHDMAAALRVIRGMFSLNIDLASQTAHLPTAMLAWAGYAADRYGDVIILLAYLSIALAFGIVSRRNSIELMNDRIGLKKSLSGAAILVVGLYATIAAPSKVFLYFNF